MINSTLMPSDLYHTTKYAPVMNWPGGKRRLIPVIEAHFPLERINSGEIDTFIEPFFGGGAMTWHMMNEYPQIKNYIINDLNPDVVSLYSCIRNNLDETLRIALELQDRYMNTTANFPDRFDPNWKQWYAKLREEFNNARTEGGINDPKRAAYMLVFSKICFNSLYRLNREGQFNQSPGEIRRKPFIYEQELLSLHDALQKVTILHGSYEGVEPYVNDRSFIYLDPPYRPLASTSGDRFYSSDDFTDKDQIILRDFCYRQSVKGAAVLMSNSDPTVGDEDDDFFDELFNKWNVYRIPVKRTISANPDHRGEVREILIASYNAPEGSESVRSDYLPVFRGGKRNSSPSQTLGAGIVAKDTDAPPKAPVGYENCETLF